MPIKKELENSISDYEEALKKFGINLAEVVNLSHHHAVHENNYDEFVKNLEDSIPIELIQEKNIPILNKIMEALSKLRSKDANS